MFRQASTCTAGRRTISRRSAGQSALLRSLFETVWAISGAWTSCCRAVGPMPLFSILLAHRRATAFAPGSSNGGCLRRLLALSPGAASLDAWMLMSLSTVDQGHGTVGEQADAASGSVRLASAAIARSPAEMSTCPALSDWHAAAQLGVLTSSVSSPSISSRSALATAGSSLVSSPALGEGRSRSTSSSGGFRRQAWSFRRWCRRW